jgi:WW domain-binding protein 2
MDFYAEQHIVQPTGGPESDSDEETSWVMLNQEGEVVKLPNEKIFHKVRSRTGLELAAPKSLSTVTPFSRKSDSGTVYITNKRVRLMT